MHEKLWNESPPLPSQPQRQHLLFSVMEVVGTSRRATWDLGSPTPLSYSLDFLSTVYPC